MPVITVPVVAGSTSVSGTSEAGASIVLTVNGLNPVTVTATGVNWTVSGLTLAAGNIVSVTALTTGNLISAPATTTVVAATTATPVITLPVIAGNTSVSGTAEVGASIVLSINTIAQPAVIATGGNWIVNGLTLATGDIISVTALTSGKLISAPATTTVGGATTATPVITVPVTAAATSVSGTAEIGASIILSINGIPQPAVIATGGIWTVSGLILVEGDLISVTAQSVGKLVSIAATTTVLVAPGVTAQPVINLPVMVGNTSVSGTAEVGATITLSINTIARPTVIATGGNWTVSGLTLAFGDAISVTAQAPGKAVSAPATTTVIAATTATPVINTPVIAGTTSVSGTAEAGATVILSINAVSRPSVTATGGNWTVSGLTLAAGDLISVTAQTPGKLVSAAATTTVVLGITATPVITVPVTAADTSVSGTAEVDAVITLSINTIAQPTVVAAGGIWTVSGLTLAEGNVISVTAQAPGKAVSAPATTTVLVAPGITATPVITLPVTTLATSVSGTSEASALITLTVTRAAVVTYTNTATASVAGAWTVTIVAYPLVVGDIITVTALAPLKVVSAPATTTVTAPAPVIQLIGSNPASAQLGSAAYADPGAVANDPIYGNLTASIVVTGTVNTAVLGTYTLTYTVTNAALVTSSITRTVNVVAMLDPLTIPQFVTPLLVPWAMPTTTSSPTLDYYEIAMRQFMQQVLPAGMPATTVWGYGSATAPGAVFNAPSLTIEATANKAVRVKWINDLIDANGNYLPHLLPVDQTLHWANPVGGPGMTDMAGTNPNPYVGPVPVVTHVHGAHVFQESDGYPEAWYLPAANSIPAGYATEGTFYAPYKATATSGALWGPGNSVFDYPNDQSASTIWYHDHAMGMTRTNVYTGPAGFYLIRGGASDQVFADAGRTVPGVIPTAIPYDVPIAIQDRTFNTDGSLFYPDSRRYFDGFAGPYIPDPASDISPIWNPEFFGNTIIANGNTWPYLNVEQRIYRFRLLNGSQARTLILNRSDGGTFTQIGAEGGFLPAPVAQTQLLLGPAERADILVDFSAIPVGTNIVLQNIGPDAPFQGGIPVPANPATTGRVMQFTVVAPISVDNTTPLASLVLPARTPVAAASKIRQVSLNEDVSALLPGVGPRAALLGTVSFAGGMIMGVPQMWMSPITENVIQGDTEIWEIYNFTMDAHPIHLHLVAFEVVDRQPFDMATGALGVARPPLPGETGLKDTVMALPGEVTRIKATFDRAGRYVWHCHILEHEDNEMMRPYLVTASAPVGVPVTSIAVSGAAGATTVVNGQNLQMSAAVLPVNATNPAVTWTVSGGNMISTTGLLMSMTVGPATVTATAQDGSGVTGSTVITVQ
jgi:FtsP/CotA-like multicopper oxidase with cupredoxin domain